MPPTAAPTVSPQVPFPTLGQHVVYTKTDGVEVPAVVYRVPNPQHPLTVDLLSPIPAYVPLDGGAGGLIARGMIANIPYNATGELKSWAWEPTPEPTPAAAALQKRLAAIAEKREKAAV